MIVKLSMVLVYLTVLLVIGALASRKMRDVGDYFVAGKRLGFLEVSFSSRATGESAWLLLGLTGMGAAVGVKALWVLAGEVLGVGGAWLLMSRRFKRLTERYDAITVPDYLEGRFNQAGEGMARRLRVVAAAALVCFVTIYVSAQIDATGTAFESFLGWNYFAGAVVGFVVVLIYITAGGFLAVAWSDVFQGSLMVLGLVVLPIAGTLALGGPGQVLARLDAIDPGLLHWSGAQGFSPLAVAGILGFLFIGLGFLGSPQVFVRFIALRSEKEIPAGAAVALTWTLLADAGAVASGMVGRALLTSPGEDVEAVLGPSGQGVLSMSVDHLFPALVGGIYVAVVLAAIMSTVDSLLVVAGSAAVRDWYQKVLHPELKDSALVPLSRRVTVTLALVALALALAVAVLVPGRTIFWFVVFGWSGIAATFCPTLILSLFWPRMTARGALVAMASGFLSVPLFKFAAPALPGLGPYFTELAELGPAFLVSGVLGVLTSLLDASGPRVSRI